MKALVENYDDWQSDEEKQTDDNIANGQSLLVGCVDRAPECTINFENHKNYLPQNFLAMKQYNIEDIVYQKYGPELKSDKLSKNNVFTGHIENAYHLSELFQQERLDFDKFGKSHNPSLPINLIPNQKSQKNDKNIHEDYIFDKDLLNKQKNTNSLKLSRRQMKKANRKIITNYNHLDINNFTGPFGKYENEITVSRPSHEDKLIIEEYMAKKQKKSTSKSYLQKEESFIRHSSNNNEKILDINPSFYNNKNNNFTNRLVKICELPTKVIFHVQNKSEDQISQNQSVNCLKWHPKLGHLLLSASGDSNCRIFKINTNPEHFCTFYGHDKSVKDLQFNNEGHQFLSASYDKTIRLWDLEKCKIITKFIKDKFPLCLKYYPEDNNYFLVGQSDKKVICYDTRDQAIQQLYDFHSDEVRTITFFDKNRRFVTTGLDNHLRVFEWGIPVETKQIKDPSIASIICAITTRDQDTMVTQSMDSIIRCFDLENGFKFNRKKKFHGHAITGYNCNIDFMPDERYLVSGDTSGSLYCWDYKTHRIERKIFIRKSVIVSVACNPYNNCYIACGDSKGAISIIG